MAFVLSVGGLLLRLCGRAAVATLLSSWLLLWLVIRPPLGLDARLIGWLQQKTTGASSKLLDLMGVYHLPMGNVIRFPTRDLFVAEACSGIHSQLALIACAALFVVAVRRSGLHGLLLIAAAVFWAAVANIGRVMLVAVTWTQLGVDLSTGWPHEVLGYLFVAAGFLLLLSTDQLLTACLSPIPVEDPTAVNPLTETWNRIFERKKNAAAWCPGSSGPSAEAGRAALSPSPLLSGAFVLLGILQLHEIAVARRPGMPESGPGLPGVPRIAFSGAELPERVGNWQKTGFAPRRSEAPRAMAKFEGVWTYAAGKTEVTFSYAFPFKSWHELTLCYKNRGWQPYRRTVHAADSEPLEDGDYIELAMNRPTGEWAITLFSFFDVSGAPIPAPESLWSTLLARAARSPLARLLDRHSFQAIFGAPAVQVQLFVPGKGMILPQTGEIARERFLALRSEFRKAWKRRISSSK